MSGSASDQASNTEVLVRDGEEDESNSSVEESGARR
jgi:hypothetical protein